ncbi:response regulator transcription factor [Massilia endophytica]|uniref:response regulator transcription factor n=1 Tax=Massilia endophytica TaxID=2899220 RepID=UPI001E59D073|nr:DNA-binding response regulator [Massilia endophytica]UGQ48170.1 DNA-binding response regulator [Massilia endophytica]
MHDFLRPRKHILIIDDSNFEQCLLMEALGRRQYHFDSARSGSQGYELAQAGVPDLILLDVRMPDMDGLTVCRLLKANAATHHIPVIFLSGATEAHERTKGLTVGGVDYVTKPYSVAELSARMQIHLTLAERLDQRRAPAAPPPPPAAQEDVRVTAAKRFIRESLADLPPVAEIARQVGSYREKLSPMFREQTGMSIAEFARSTRLERARSLLETTELDIQEIAMLTGYNNGGNFATAFKTAMGMTPKEYRQHAACSF